MGRAVTDSSTYELGKTLTWGSIRADVECRASYASGIIGGTHVPLQEHTAAANFFSLGSLYCLGAVEVQGRRRPETLGEGTGKGRRIAHALGASVQQRELGGGGREVTMGTLGQQAPHHSGAARQAGGICAWQGKVGHSLLHESKKQRPLASGATVAGCVCRHGLSHSLGAWGNDHRPSEVAKGVVIAHLHTMAKWTQMRVGGLGGDDWTGPAAATRGAEGTGGEGRRTRGEGRRTRDDGRRTT
ncbi:hypothetical protein BGZ57DRAFT_922849 [Hyaloscypha finlandica]|nr:hypothetical protein BGZ57DRAFT_922849 [Hyaloscypha finlandica]